MYFVQTRYKNLNLARKLNPEVMERLYLKDDSAHSPSVKTATSNSLSGKAASPTKLSKQKQDQETVPEVPVRDKKEVYTCIYNKSVDTWVTGKHKLCCPWADVAFQLCPHDNIKPLCKHNLCLPVTHVSTIT